MRLRRKETPLVPPAVRGRRGPRAVLAALVVAAVPAAAAPAAVAAAVPSLDFMPHSAGARLNPGDMTVVRNATSTNWAGYAAHSTKYTSVSATWREPSAS